MVGSIDLVVLPPRNDDGTNASNTLAAALGFAIGPQIDRAYLPWIDYIRGHSPEVASEDDFLRLCKDVICHFKRV